MNFADILNQWEKGQSGSCAAGRSTKNNPSRNGVSRNVMETWLQNNEIFDKDANAEKALARGVSRSRRLRIPPDDVLDIHGLTSAEAWLSLESFFTKAKNNGFEKLRIIHGKGNHSKGEAVLGRAVQKFIEQCSFAGESGHEKAVNGGTGSTWVLLK